MSDLFAAAGLPSQSPSKDLSDPLRPLGGDDPRLPLAERLRPKLLSEVMGQDHLLGTDGPIGRMVRAGRLSSMILWGPPGVGKTTIARLLAEAAGYEFQQISAVFSGVADLKKVFEAARLRQRNGGRTLLFVDEIHRFNKAQQDSFLPYVEAGTVTLVGATTENPSFELNGALLSRAQVYVLNRLEAEDLEALLKRAESLEGRPLPLEEAARGTLLGLSDGDGRYLLSLAETLFSAVPEDQAPLDGTALGKLLQKRRPSHDKAGEGHYNLISALHKSVRASDPDAALYWFARMVEAGEDRLFIARRLIRMASEDIGAADPMALVVASHAKEAFEMLGSPEGELALAQAVVHLASAPKSNAVYKAYKAALVAAQNSSHLAPNPQSMNAPTKLMKELGYGAGYAYDHDYPDAFSGQNHLPEALGRPKFYAPTDRGHEGRVKERLQRLEALRQTKRQE